MNSSVRNAMFTVGSPPLVVSVSTQSPTCVSALPAQDGMTKYDAAPQLAREVASALGIWAVPR